MEKIVIHLDRNQIYFYLKELIEGITELSGLDNLAMQVQNNFKKGRTIHLFTICNKEIKIITI